MTVVRVQVFISCYKRPEYTEISLAALDKNTLYEDVQFYLVDDGSKDRTKNILQAFKEKRPNTIVKIHEENGGLRKRLLEFFDTARADYLCKVDNDCLFPEAWLSTLLRKLKEANLDVIAPNEVRRNPANRLGTYDKESGIHLLNTRAKAVGGIWVLKRKILDGFNFRTFLGAFGVKGAWQLMTDIKRAGVRMGFTKEVGFEHIGERQGNHTLSIQTTEYQDYIKKIGRGSQRGWWNSTRRGRQR